jgi:alpha-tubulin suppressor-like RCC1 family protein
MDDVNRALAEQDQLATERAVPRHIAELDGAVGFALGQFHSCAVLRGGAVWCWGHNDSGQLGDGTTAARTTPVEVTGVTDAVAVAVGTWHSCALGRAGRVTCWGRNALGQLGDGTGSDRPRPAPVVGLPTGS